MRNYTCIFILVSFLVGVIAPACGFSWGGKYSVIEICTTQGIESRIVENTNNNKNDHKQADRECPFCFQNGHLKDYIYPQSALALTLSDLQRIQVLQYETVLLARQHSPQSLRGPPYLI